MAETLHKRCIIIPAIKKNAVIPDQLVKKLAGKTLIARALDTALGVVFGEDILVVTDSQEIRLICERAGVGCECNPEFVIPSLNIVAALRPVLERMAMAYERLIIYRASSPLVTAVDIEDAYSRFVSSDNDCLVTVKNVKHRLWEEKGSDIDALLFNETEQTVYVESKSLVMLRSEAVLQQKSADGRALRTMPYFLHDRGIEITSYLDWWVCEKILLSKHIVFVVAGYPAIGMGHIFRALMLAHEIADHRITFLCTEESELAASSIAAKDYRTRVQQTDSLAADVLRLRPDLVVNDILDTTAGYMGALQSSGVKTVNFEDEGEGARLADLVVNALYRDKGVADPRLLSGHKYFCLRDEFLQADQNEFRPCLKRLLVTFGGTDHSDYTRATLNALFPLCREHEIQISIVVGPGYVHKDSMADYLKGLDPEGLFTRFTYATNVMSREMEQTDLAICSAGRTVYELAHMRIPAIVLAHNERECRHVFARPENGFTYLGYMREFDGNKLCRAFRKFLNSEFRGEYHARMERFDFSPNKARVVRKILGLLHD